MVLGYRGLALALMHRMQDLNPDRVHEGLKEMGASRAELREAHALWMRWAYSRTAPKGMRAYRTVLGPPLARGPRAFGDLTCTAAVWVFPTWPGLHFEVLAGPDGSVWNQWFVRPGEPRAVPFAGLEPWTCVVADVGASFPDAQNVEGGAPHHWAVDFTHEGAAWRAGFVYGLLQRVDPRPDAA